MASDRVLDIFLTESDIRDRVATLGKEISLHFGARDITVLAVLKGALFFCADLMRQIDSPLRYELVRASSYGAGTEPQGPPRLELPDELALQGREVLLVEDIVDTGATLHELAAAVASRGPKSLRTCALLNKRARRRFEVEIDWIGFEIPDVFVVGYGLDYAEQNRNLPYLAVLRDS